MPRIFVLLVCNVTSKWICKKCKFHGCRIAKYSIFEIGLATYRSLHFLALTSVGAFFIFRGVIWKTREKAVALFDTEKLKIKRILKLSWRRLLKSLFQKMLILLLWGAEVISTN